MGLYSFSVFSHRNHLTFNITVVKVVYAIAASYSPLLIALIALSFDRSHIASLDILSRLWADVGLFGLIFPICQVIHHHIKSKSTAVFLQSITRFDDKSRQFGIFMSYKTELKIVKITILSGIIIILEIFSYPVAETLLGNSVEWKMSFSHGIQYFYFYYSIAEIFIIIWAVNVRIEGLSLYLEKTIFTSQRHLKKFLKLINELCDLIDLVNSTFSLNMIFALANILVLVTFGFYSLLQALQLHGDAEIIVMVMNTISWILVQFSMTCIIVNAGSRVQANLLKMSSIAIRRLNSSLNEGINNELRDLILQLKCRNSKIECIFFTIDWSVIFGVSFDHQNFSFKFKFYSSYLQMISTVFTYLVITWQTFGQTKFQNDESKQV